MVDWTDEPRTTQQWQAFIDALKARDVAAAAMNFTDDTNIPDGVIRWNSSAEKFEIRDNGGWVNLSNNYKIDVYKLNGLDESDFTPIGHVGSRGSAHANATQSDSGFLSSTDKFKLDSSTSSATANTIVQRDSSGRFRANAPSASNDVARKNEIDNLSANNLVSGTVPIGRLDSIIQYIREELGWGVGPADAAKNITDLNDSSLPSGMYEYHSGVFNKPTGHAGGGGGVLYLREDDGNSPNVVKQIAYDRNGLLFSRSFYNGSWTPWVKFITDDILNDQTLSSIDWDTPTGNIPNATSVVDLLHGIGIGANSGNLTNYTGDIDDIERAGLYSVAGNTNAATSNDAVVFMGYYSGSSKAFQFWLNTPNTPDKEIWYRTRGSDGSWSSWDQIWPQKNIYVSSSTPNDSQGQDGDVWFVV